MPTQKIWVSDFILYLIIVFQDADAEEDDG